jgi:hypothetical protein
LSRFLNRVVVMKSSQWISALVVLVVMVFAITFAMNYINPSKPPPTAPPGPPPDGNGKTLTFFDKTLGEDPTQPRTWIYHEDGTGGSADFLFENENAEEVIVGLIGKNCVCTSVQVVLASAEWRQHRAKLTEAKERAEMPFLHLVGPAGYWDVQTRAPKVEEDRELQEMERAGQEIAKLEPLDVSQQAKVPPKSMGWIRLSWDDNKKQALKRFKGDVWMGSPNSGMTATLEAEVHFVGPVQAEKAMLTLSDLNEADLEKADRDGKPLETSVRVWSATRPSLRLKTEVVRPLRFAASRFDPLEIGQPVPLSTAETAALQREAFDAGTVRCAYRIPIKLHGISPDQKVRVDLGPFRRRFVVKSDADDGVQPIELTVVGTVQGRVRVGNEQDGGRLSMGVFNSDEGSSPSSLALAAQGPGVDLEVDKERTPEFLREGVRLESVKKGDELPRWKLSVRVPPNAARGQFPRPDSEMYLDGAVYLKVKGEAVQNIRVPVDGTANVR